MGDVNAPLAALLTSRPAFGGTTEAIEFGQLTDTALRKGQVSWLEVGAGDGSNLAFQLDRLIIGRKISAIAIEPAAVARSRRRDVEWLTVRVEDYAADRKFDWINVRHSAYYLNDAIGELTRLVEMLAGGGTLALTHWSRDCILHRLHRQVTSEPGATSCAGIEDIAALLRCDPGMAVSAPMFHESRLDVDRLLSDRSLRDALLDLTRRGRAALPWSSGGDPDALSSLLRTIPSPDIRRNGIVLVQASGS